MARIGIFPGTFDPVHQGHIAFSLRALREAQLELVALLPEASPRRKQQVTSLDHRYNMLEKALIGQTQLTVRKVQSTQFTVAETLPELHALFPQQELCLLLGSDVVQGLRHWPGLADLAASLEFVVGLRAEHTQSDIEQQLRRLARETGIPLRFVLVQAPHAHLASSQIRSQLSPQGLFEPVAEYIQRHGLYTDNVPAAQL
jgi:nicotinate-nucleotide adenylyltransferase